MKKKIGRNDPCPCGSGQKYKKCHGSHRQGDPSKFNPSDSQSFQNISSNIQNKIIEQEIIEKRRKLQYGNTRRIISADFNGYKIVAVGNQLHYSKKWRTFHDFLFDYIKNVLGPEWGNSELRKDFAERHPIIQWYKFLCDFQRKHTIKEGNIYSATCTGKVGAYISLAYDLYVLRHHSLLQKRLIERLKDKKQFQGARYEIYVTSSFIKAGFEIAFEDESDKSKSHCEFVATHKISCKKYSVESKSRHRPGILGQNGSPYKPDEIRIRVGGLLRSALKKKASNSRIVFIDINMPPEEGGLFDKKWFRSLMDEVKKVEEDKIDDNPAPPAYLFFTNHPNHYVGDGAIEPEKNFLMTAINMPHFKVNAPEEARQTDPPVFELWESMNVHIRIPNDFDEKG